MDERVAEPFERMLRSAGLRRFEREPWVNPYTGRVEHRVLGRLKIARWRVSEAFYAEYLAPLLVEPGLMLTYGGAPVEVDEQLRGQAVQFDLAD